MPLKTFLDAKFKNIIHYIKIFLWSAPHSLPKPDYPKAYLRLQELFFIFKEVITDSINYLFEFRCSESRNLSENF